jgi:hypothetical protein
LGDSPPLAKGEGGFKFPPEDDERLKNYLHRAIAAKARGDLKQVATELRAYKADFLETKSRLTRGEIDPEFRSAIEQAREHLEQSLNSRASRFDLTSRYEVSHDAGRFRGVESWTSEHLKVLNELFGTNNLKPFTLPTAEELRNLDGDYLAMMYPDRAVHQTQIDEDKAKGLISYRPNWFSQEADESVVKTKETWWQAYKRSLLAELTELGGSILLAETIQKPKYTNGTQQYGSIDGTDPSLDPLLSVFHEVFGADSNRFNHTWDEIQTQLIPKVKAKLTQNLKDKGLPIPNFDIIMLPATASSLQTTFQTQDNSKTDTNEWNSTILRDVTGNDTDRRLSSGYSAAGGAARLSDGHRGDHWGSRGVRLAVVLRPAE